MSSSSRRRARPREDKLVLAKMSSSSIEDERLREDELVLDRRRARPRFCKNQLLAAIFGPRSTPRHEVDGMCMTHSSVSCPAFQINLELSETNILCFSPVLVKSGQNDSKIMVWDDVFSGNLTFKNIFFQNILSISVS